MSSLIILLPLDVPAPLHATDPAPAEVPADSPPRVNAVRAFGDTPSHAPASDPPSATPSETTADAVPGESR